MKKKKLNNQNKMKGLAAFFSKSKLLKNLADSESIQIFHKFNIDNYFLSKSMKKIKKDFIKFSIMTIITVCFKKWTEN